MRSRDDHSAGYSHKEMRIGIIGSRRRHCEGQVRRPVRSLPVDVTLVSGGCRGPDRWAVEEAKIKGMKTEIHRPQPQGPGYGFFCQAARERNRKIAETGFPALLSASLEKIVRSYAFEALSAPDIETDSTGPVEEWWQKVLQADFTRYESPSVGEDIGVDGGLIGSGLIWKRPTFRPLLLMTMGTETVTAADFDKKKGLSVLANPLIFIFLLVPEERLELSRGCPHWILSPARLPVSPLRHRWKNYCQTSGEVSRGINGQSDCGKLGLHAHVDPGCQDSQLLGGLQTGLR